MASELKVDKFTGVTTAGSILVTGEGNSTTTNLQQGLAKCWVTHPHDDVVDDSFNLSSLTDSATGRYICNFTNNMASTKYIVPATGASYGSSNDRGGDFVGMDMDAGSTDSRSTSACNTANNAGSNSSADASLVDRGWTMHIFFGDLA
jgi:hypothetical protein